MKLSSIVALFTLSAVVRGWAALLQPIVLSIGAAFTALNLELEPLLDLKFNKWLSSADKTDDEIYDDESKIKLTLDENN